MALLNTHHDNPASAALSMTNNRAQKIGKLIDSGAVKIALRNADSLVADVLDWLVSTEGSAAKAMFATQIAETALHARRSAMRAVAGFGSTNIIVVLPDGETFAAAEGTSFYLVPEANDTEEIEAALAEGALKPALALTGALIEELIEEEAKR